MDGGFGYHFGGIVAPKFLPTFARHSRHGREKALA
jgi:hypothetical protein